VGALVIRGDALKATLPAGSAVELTLELDRGGRLSARALVVSTGQVFEQVAQLLVPDASVEALETGLAATRARLATMRTNAFRLGLTRQIAELGALEHQLGDVELDTQAAKGGDADLAQRARRSLIEVDAAMEQLEADSKFPELEEEAVNAITAAGHWISRFGTPQEQRLLDEAIVGVERARKAKQVLELQRRVRQVRDLGTAAFYKNPDAWLIEFDFAASQAHEAHDLPRAEKLVAEGKVARGTGDKPTLQRVTQALWKLLPADAQDRKLGHDSGVR
jgi:molecular chaperone DnaK